MGRLSPLIGLKKQGLEVEVRLERGTLGQGIGSFARGVVAQWLQSCTRKLPRRDLVPTEISPPSPEVGRGGILVEAPGVEPGSESDPLLASTCVGSVI